MPGNDGNMKIGLKVDTFFEQALIDDSVADNLFACLKGRHQDIEALINIGWTHKQICEGLNENGVEISFPTFRTYLYRMRKKTAKKAGEESRRPTLELDNREESDNEDDWNDTEKLIGYRLEDCIRPFVRVVDGKIERSFKTVSYTHLTLPTICSV